MLSVVVGIVVVVVGLVVSIGLHEVGHMVPAKRFGVRVSQYMVGFGPTLWSRTKGETEYGLKAFPLGGYVRLVGMMPPAPPGARPVGGFFGQVIGDARDASVAEIHPGEERRAFYNLSAPKKLVVMFGGPFMNLVIAVVLMFVVLVGIGLPAVTTTVGAVSDCVPAAATPAGQEPECTGEAAPAQAAGIEAGDTFVRYDGRQVTSWDDVRSRIEESAGQPVEVVVERDGQQVPLTLIPVERERVVLDSAGEPRLDADGEPVTETVGFLGVSMESRYEPLPISTVPEALWQQVSGTATVLVTLPVRVAEAAVETFTDAPRSADGPVSIIGVGRLAVDVVAADDPILMTLQRLLLLLAALNIALFVFNLIPLLPLDGGHMVNALYEGAKRTVARVRGLPTPGPADVARMMPVAYVMFVVLLGVGLVLMLADVIDPIRLA